MGIQKKACKNEISELSAFIKAFKPEYVVLSFADYARVCTLLGEDGSTFATIYIRGTQIRNVLDVQCETFGRALEAIRQEAEK